MQCRLRNIATIVRMVSRRVLIHTTFVVLLPIIVVWFGVGVTATLGLVALGLLWRWLIVLSGIIAPEKTPDLVLHTMAISHFVEKVRWCMDRLDIDYTEKQVGGTLSVFFTGRTVPQLRAKTGLVQTSIGNSPDILRYLWGRYFASHGERASFLEPTAERLELEKKLDRYGRILQVWIYSHILEHRDLTLHFWGANNPRVAKWQRLALRALFPLLAVLLRKSFAINPAHYARAVSLINELLGEIDLLLADGRRSILGGDSVNYTDFTFAAFSGLWLQPKAYAGGMAEGNLIRAEQMPAAMRTDIERWSNDHPKAVALVTRLYADDR